MTMTLFPNSPIKNTQTDFDILSVFKQNDCSGNQIQQGMSPKEIAEVTSTHLMNVIRKQFEDAGIEAKQNR